LHAIHKAGDLHAAVANADGSFSSYYGRYGGSGFNTSFVQDADAGYAALQCSQVLNFPPACTPNLINTC
jgi:hypothetical protein